MTPMSVIFMSLLESLQNINWRMMVVLLQNGTMVTVRRFRVNGSTRPDRLATEVVGSDQVDKVGKMVRR